MIDLVVPYVDSTDVEWQKIFNIYNPEKTTEGINAKNRFRGQGDFFKYFFRCIEVNMPFINKIFLIVQSESQVPNWINREKVDIVLHKDFIPEEYLPTFNSCTIEMFLWNIPALSERFIYANDDLFLLNKSCANNFFYDKVLFNYCIGDVGNTMYNHHCSNCYRLIYSDSRHSFKPGHNFRPYLKSKMIECYEKYKKEITESITQFRSTNNYNAYLYSVYLCKNNLVLNKGLTEGSSWDLDCRNCDTICINDIDPNTNIYENERINKWFELNYPFASVYEINYNKDKKNNPKRRNSVRSSGFSYLDIFW